MEATHLGAMLAEAKDHVLDDAIGLLSGAPSYRDRDWLSVAFHCKEYLQNAGIDVCRSLGIPTWLYGHEPPTPFASHIAKFFNNSIREEGLITVAHAGIIFAPGSAGTVQELFQDAAQNHYATTGYASPMVFMDRRYWTETIPVWPVLQAMSPGRPYASNLHLADGIVETASLFDAVKKIPVEGAHWEFCKAYCDEDQNENAGG
jgi:hypothetical protein